ncbi:hypothetical protein VM1G_11732 [Cytospora mali]|uniref:Secreted protein n=1 Tax=Cytospora mali TaxID=578113 RepID=A0A194W5F8_CYTMA|nr:hypothetical protein VM1G_11732 [Valsa mali]
MQAHVCTIVLGVVAVAVTVAVAVAAVEVARGRGSNRAKKADKTALEYHYCLYRVDGDTQDSHQTAQNVERL